jgi:hypothetical protein
LSGRRLSFVSSIIAVATMTITLSLLFWPFAELGHTSVITSGLFMLGLLSVSLNQKFANNFPVLFISIAISLGVIISSSWFPFFPLVAAIILVYGISLARTQISQGRTKRVIAIATIIALIAATQASTLSYLLVSDGLYLGLQGGTRAATDLLVVLWIGLVAFSIWQGSHKKSAEKEPIPRKFNLAIVAVLGTATYLLARGLATNDGFGYGATKYLLTVIALSTPLLWLIVFSNSRKKLHYRDLALAILIVLAVLVAQPDSRPTAGFLAGGFSSTQTTEPPVGVIQALKIAVDKKPDHVLCVSDIGYPAPNQEVRFHSYLCTRWAQALVGGNSESDGWGFVPLGRLEVTYMNEVVRAYKDRKVILLRFIDPTNPIPVDETWWADFVDPNWEVITVP